MDGKGSWDEGSEQSIRRRDRTKDGSLRNNAVFFIAPTVPSYMSGIKAGSPSDVFHLLGDDYAREILAAAEEPVTAKDLSDATDASLTTVYRRLSALKEHGLVEERSTVDPDASHKREFVTAVDEIHAELSDGSFSLTVEKRDELADNFTSLWSDIRDSR